jgi:hypothetical protein
VLLLYIKEIPIEKRRAATIEEKEISIEERRAATIKELCTREQKAVIIYR